MPLTLAEAVGPLGILGRVNRPSILIAVCDSADPDTPQRVARAAVRAGHTVGVVDLTAPHEATGGAVGHFRIRQDEDSVHRATWVGARSYTAPDIDGAIAVLGTRGCGHVIVTAFDGGGKVEHRDHTIAVMSLALPSLMVRAPFDTDAVLAALDVT